MSDHLSETPINNLDSVFNDTSVLTFATTTYNNKNIILFGEEHTYKNNKKIMTFILNEFYLNNKYNSIDFFYEAYTDKFNHIYNNNDGYSVLRPQKGGLDSSISYLKLNKELEYIKPVDEIRQYISMLLPNIKNCVRYTHNPNEKNMFCRVIEIPINETHLKDMIISDGEEAGLLKHNVSYTIDDFINILSSTEEGIDIDIENECEYLIRVQKDFNKNYLKLINNEPLNYTEGKFLNIEEKDTNKSIDYNSIEKYLFILKYIYLICRIKEFNIIDDDGKKFIYLLVENIYRMIKNIVDLSLNNREIFKQFIESLESKRNNTIDYIFDFWEDIYSIYHILASKKDNIIIYEGNFHTGVKLELFKKLGCDIQIYYYKEDINKAKTTYINNINTLGNISKILGYKDLNDMINMNNITDLDINKSYYMNYSTIQNISVINLFLNENNENKTDINIEDEIAKLNKKIKIIPQYKNMRLSFNNVTNTKFIKLCQLVKYLNYRDIGDFFMNLYKYAYNLHYDMLYNFNNIYDTIVNDTILLYNTDNNREYALPDEINIKAFSKSPARKDPFFGGNIVINFLPIILFLSKYLYIVIIVLLLIIIYYNIKKTNNLCNNDYV